MIIGDSGATTGAVITSAGAIGAGATSGIDGMVG